MQSRQAAFFEPFDRIVVVNLPERTDRRSEMEYQFARVGVAGDPRISYFPAIRTPDSGPFARVGSHGNFLSRIQILKDVASRGQSILILEDDCDFLMPEVLKASLPPQWDIVYGGYEASDNSAVAEAMIIGSHCMGFSARAAQLAAKYLERYIQPDFPPDPVAAQEEGYDPSVRPPIDGAFVWFRRAYPELSTIFVKVSVQRPSRTDVGEQPMFDRYPGLREAAGLARRMRRWVFGSRARHDRHWD